ncbi:transmembrane amino acid transporter protein-domain-containing protein [Xylariomycetidae sp. FL0641]|nr:transmembrane amino acid transporter protein-domain-containing protein [Xylariomycetidae sp. FL0641]
MASPAYDSDSISPELPPTEKPLSNEASPKDAGPPSFAQEDASGSDINFHSLEWWQASLVMIAETISLGILSLPSVVAILGLVPGIILIVFLGILSTYSGLVMGEFKLAYPWVQNFGDAGEVFGRSIGMGRAFQEFFGWAQTIFQIFVMGSHLLTWTICMNTLTGGSTCTIVWAVVGLAISWVLNVPRTLKYASYMSILSFLSIFVAVLMTIIDVGIERPIGNTPFDIFRPVGFTTAFLSVTNIAVAFSGHSAFFSIMSELKRPEDWPKALSLLQICDTTIYIVAAVVIYIYVGPDSPSPALTAAGSVTIRKAIWGVAIPTIIIAGVIYAHVCAQYIFVRVFRNTRHLEKRTVVGTAGWLGITAAVWIIAFIIAESIPVFSSLLGLICALFATWFSYGIPGAAWLYMHHGAWFADTKRTIKFASNVVLFLTGLAICILGLWSSAEAIHNETATEAWSCKSNA